MWSATFAGRPPPRDARGGGHRWQHPPGRFTRSNAIPREESAVRHLASRNRPQRRAGRYPDPLRGRLRLQTLRGIPSSSSISLQSQRPRPLPPDPTALLPLLTANRGQIVFVNPRRTRRGRQRGTDAATKHALKAIADSLRQELNPEGVRALMVFPGRTATPGMQDICAMEKQPYAPELLLQPPTSPTSSSTLARPANRGSDEYQHPAVHDLAFGSVTNATTVFFVPSCCRCIWPDRMTNLGDVGRRCTTSSRRVVSDLPQHHRRRVRQTLAIRRTLLPWRFTRCPPARRSSTGPCRKEWNIRDAYIKDSDGRPRGRFSALEPARGQLQRPRRARLTLEELRPHLFTLPEHPDWIPYRTSYYEETWGFCLTPRAARRLAEGATKSASIPRWPPGSLTYGEAFLRRATPRTRC